MSEIRKFHLGDILSATTGLLVSLTGVYGLREILEHVTRKSLQTLELMDAAKKVKPFLLEQHPWLQEIAAKDVGGDDWEKRLSILATQYGEYHEVESMPQDHEDVDPVEDARRLGFQGIVIILDLTDDEEEEEEEEEPSSYGDINWKVDDDDKNR